MNKPLAYPIARLPSFYLPAYLACWCESVQQAFHTGGQNGIVSSGMGGAAAATRDLMRILW